MAKSKRNKRKKSGATSVAIEDSQSELKKLESLCEEAESAIDSFNYDEAESKLQEILQIDSRNCKYLEMLAGVFIETFQFEKAQDILKQCIEISPEVGYSKYFSIGQLYEGLDAIKYYEKGIQILEKELENGEIIELSKEQNKATLVRNLSDAYCSVSELFMTDCCFEENAEEKCYTAINAAIKSDPANPEAYQCLANFQLVKEQTEEAKESLQKSLSLWLPHLEKQREEGLDENDEKETEIAIPGYDSRIKTSKLLIELEMFYEASKILEGLLEEDDEVIEVWYLLGWLNYLRGEDEYKRNAHFYFKKAKQVNTKLGLEEDECIQHIKELLEELNSTHPISDEEDENGEENNNSDSDFETDSESEEAMETL